MSVDETAWLLPPQLAILPPGVAPGAIPCTGRSAVPALGAIGTWSGTDQTNHVVQFNVHGLQVAYWLGYNSSGAEAPLPNTLTLTASVQFPLATTPFRFTFGGQASVVGGSANPGAVGLWVISDPLDVDIPAGTRIYVRTFALPPAAGNFGGLCYFQDPANGDESNRVSGTGGVDTTANSAAMANAATTLLGPTCILGIPYLNTAGARPAQRTVGEIGGSIAKGSGDYPPDLGYMRRANGAQSAWTVGAGASQEAYGVYRVAFASDQAQLDASNVSRARLRLIGLCTNTYNDLAGNDISAGQTLAQIQANKILLWNWQQARGIKGIFEMTVTPGPSSTDGWSTLINQIPNANEAARKAYNGWLRAGAPILAGVAVAVGTPGATTCPVYNSRGQLTQAASGQHPCAGVCDPAAAIESSFNSGIFTVQNVRIVNDAATTTNGSTLSSATANFTTADIGSFVCISGAGASGALYFGWISGGTSTVANLSPLVPPHGQASGNTTPTAVSNARAAIGTPCVDGVHPSSQLHQLAASAIPAAALIAA